MGVFDHGWVMVIEKTWTRDATMNHRHRWVQSMGAFARNSGLPSEPVGWPRHPKIQQDRKGHPTLLSICSSKACTALHGLRQALGFEGQSEYYALPNFLPTVFCNFISIFHHVLDYHHIRNHWVLLVVRFMAFKLWMGFLQLSSHRRKANAHWAWVL